jgi:hypothetical protein
MLNLFSAGYPHGIFAQGAKRLIKKFGRNIILLWTAKTSLPRLNRLRYAFCAAFGLRQRLTVRIGHENTSTSVEVPEGKEDYVPDAHPAPRHTSSVRFRMMFAQVSSALDDGSVSQVET